jgi:hypothetical protein
MNFKRKMNNFIGGNNFGAQKPCFYLMFVPASRYIFSLRFKMPLHPITIGSGLDQTAIASKI